MGAFDDIVAEPPERKSVFADIVEIPEPAEKSQFFGDLEARTTLEIGVDPNEPSPWESDQPSTAPFPEGERTFETRQVKGFDTGVGLVDVASKTASLGIAAADTAREFFAKRSQDFGFTENTQRFFDRALPGTIGEIESDVLEAGLVGFEATITAGLSVMAGLSQTIVDLGLADQSDQEDLEKALVEGSELSLLFAGVAGAPAPKVTKSKAIARIPKKNQAAARQVINDDLAAAQLKIGNAETLVTKQALGKADAALALVQDDLRPVLVAEREALKQGEIPPDLNPYRDLRLTRGSRGTIKSVMEHGTVAIAKNGDLVFNGIGLKDVIKPLEGKLDRAMEYFIGRRAQELTKQEREVLFTERDINALLDVGEDAALFERQFQEWQGFNNRVLDFAEQSGLLSKEARGIIAENNKSYVPFNRVLDETGIKQKGSLFQRLKGGEANIKDVLDNMVGNTASIIDAAIKNRAKVQAYDLIDQFGLDQFATKVTGKRAISLGKIADKKVVDALKEMGIKEDLPVMTFNRPVGENIDMVLRNGKREFYEINDPHMLAGMRGLGPKNFNLAVKIISGFKNVLTRGTTLAPDFLLKNAMRDTQSAFAQTKGSFIPIVSSIRGLKTRMLRDENYWSFLANGGGFSTLYKGDVATSAALRRLYATRGIHPTRVLDSPGRVMDFLEVASSAFEEAARLEEFKMVREATGSAREGAFAAREVSTDFALRGHASTVQTLAATVPFLNARFQGLAKLARTAKEKPGVLAVKGLSMITIPSLALYAYNKSNPAYQALDDWIKDQSWPIFLPGDDEPFLIPKGFEFGAVFATVPERMFEAIELQYGQRFTDAMLRMMQETFAADLPSPFAGIRDIATNEKFTGAQVVPTDLQDVRPSEQFRPQTSTTMVELAKFLREDAGIEMSPLQAEHLVRSLLGTLGAYALDAADGLVDAATDRPTTTKRLDELPVFRSFVRQQPYRGTSFESDFFELLQETRQITSTVSKMTKEGREPNLTDEEKINFVLADPMERVSAIASRLNKAFRATQLDTSLNPDERLKALDEIREQRNKLFREFAIALSSDEDAKKATRAIGATVPN